MPGDLLFSVVVAQAPHLPVLIIAVEVYITQLRKFVALVNIAAGYGARFRMVMFDHWRDNRSWPAFAVRVEGVSALHNAPSPIAAALHQLDHFPQFLTNIPDPRLA